MLIRHDLRQVSILPHHLNLVAFQRCQINFQGLVHAYMRARDAVHTEMPETSQVRDDFRRVEALIERLTGFYGGVGYYGRVYPGYFGVEAY